MSGPLEEKKNRRELLRTLCRGAALCCLTVVCAAAVVKKPTDGEDGECTDPALCEACGAFGRCGLPPARAAWRARREK